MLQSRVPWHVHPTFVFFAMERLSLGLRRPGMQATRLWHWLWVAQPRTSHSFPPEASRAPAAQVWTRLDTVTGEAQMWSPGARCFCEELMFQPGAAGAEVEDDGFLLGMYFDAEQQRSCLVVRRRSFSWVLLGGVGDLQRCDALLLLLLSEKLFSKRT